MFCGVTSTPVLDFWWIAFPTYLIAVQNRFLRPTSSATPAYLLAADSFDLLPLSNIGERRTKWKNSADPHKHADSHPYVIPARLFTPNRCSGLMTTALSVRSSTEPRVIRTVRRDVTTPQTAQTRPLDTVHVTKATRLAQAIRRTLMTEHVGPRHWWRYINVKL